MASPPLLRSARNLRVDFLRGLFVAVLIIDHVAGRSPLYLITGGGEFYVTAAEGFVCISGFVFAVVYTKVLASGGMRAVWTKALQRSLVLWMVMLGSTALLVVGGSLARLPWSPVHSIEEYVALLARVATFSQWFRLTRILGMYSVILAFAPIAMWLLSSRRTALLLAASWGIYLLYESAPLRFGWPLPPDAYFHPYAYQLLFVNAMVLGYHRDTVRRLLTPERMRVLLRLCVLGAVGLLAIYVVNRWLVGSAALQTLLGQLFYRDLLRPGRLVAVGCFGLLLYSLVDHYWPKLERSLGWLLLPLGTYALFSYALHIPLTVVSDVLAVGWAGAGNWTLLLNTAAQLTVLFAIWIAVRVRRQVW